MTWTVDARAHDALSHLVDMTFQKRRQWARVFIGARHHGLGRGAILLFSLACARQQRTGMPVLVALRVVIWGALIRGRWAHVAWHLSPMWAPRAVGAIAVAIALWGVLSLEPRPVRVEPPLESLLPKNFTSDWLSNDGGSIAVPMPSKRMNRQQAPPCLSAPSGQVEINGGCWLETVGRPPCGQIYEHSGKCYMPVRETPRPPTSVDP